MVNNELTGFLYPFIDADEHDGLGLIAELVSSARSKVIESRELRKETLERCRVQLERAGTAMGECFRNGGRLFAFGNGGSATDADGAVELFRTPPTGYPLPALSLVEDTAVLTALANDVGFDLVFARQLIAHARKKDIAVGFSTSGDSVNMLRAFDEASRRGLLTIGFCGQDRSAMAVSDAVQHCLVVRSASVHRIQEAQDALMVELWSIVQGCLDEKGML